MKIRNVNIKNFRCLVDVGVPISDMTVLVGENNSGKTAFLDALRLALTRNITGRRNNPFDEYDYHISQPGDTPQSNLGIEIEIWFQEDEPNEWPQEILQVLDEIIQTDPYSGINSVGLRISSKYNADTADMDFDAIFLDINGQRIGGRAQNHEFHRGLSTYVRFFYLQSLRDSSIEFSPRSQFWGRFIKDVEIEDNDREKLIKRLERINNDLLKSDPRMPKVLESLDQASKTLKTESGKSTTIQALPMMPWDLMAKSELVMKIPGSKVGLPLDKHGQGMQSLAILFLFQAYIDFLMKPSFEQETEAILALEEPEAHLHPHATRNLLNTLEKIDSQKIISSHSPYFTQDFPLKNIRLFHRSATSVQVHYIKRSFEEKIPFSQELFDYCAANPQYEFDQTHSILKAYKSVSEDECRHLMSLYPGNNDIHILLRSLQKESRLFITDEELLILETYAKRIRGELFFARAWLLCEGQCEYLIYRYFADVLGLNLDQFGITVIDFQNNGSPEIFIKLAESFHIPWLLVCDGDSQGCEYVKKIRALGLDHKGIEKRTRVLPYKSDLEKFLCRNGFTQDYIDILHKGAISAEPNAPEWEIVKFQREKIVIDTEGNIEIRVSYKSRPDRIIDNTHRSFDKRKEKLVAKKIGSKDKLRYAHGLVEHMQLQDMDGTKVPSFMRNVIKDTIKLTRR